MLKNIGVTFPAGAGIKQAACREFTNYLKDIPVIGGALLTVGRGAAWFTKTTVAIGPSAIFANIADNVAGDYVASLFSEKNRSSAREHFHFIAFFMPEIATWATKGATTQAIAALGLTGLSQAFSAFAGSAFSMGIVGYSFDFVLNGGSTGYEVTLNSRAAHKRGSNFLWKYGIAPTVGELLTPVLCSNTNPFGWATGILEFLQVKAGLKNRELTCHAAREELRKHDKARLDTYLRSLRQTFKELVAFGDIKEGCWEHYIPPYQFEHLIKNGWLDGVVANQVRFAFNELPLSGDDKMLLANLAFTASQIFDRNNESTPLRRFLSKELMSVETIDMLRLGKLPDIDFFRKERFDELLNWLGEKNILAERRQRFYAALIEARGALDSGSINSFDEKMIELGRAAGFIIGEKFVKNEDYYIALHRYHNAIAQSGSEQKLAQFDSFIQKLSEEFKNSTSTDVLPEFIITGSFSRLAIDFENDGSGLLEQLRQNKKFMPALKKIFDRTEGPIRTKVAALLAVDKLANGGDVFERTARIFPEELKHQIGVHKLQADILGEESDSTITVALNGDTSINGSGIGYLHSWSERSVATAFDLYGELKDKTALMNLVTRDIELFTANLTGTNMPADKKTDTLRANHSHAVKIYVKLRRHFAELWLNAYEQSVSSGEDPFELFDKLLEKSSDSSVVEKIVMLAAYKKISSGPKNDIWRIFTDGIFTTDGKVADKAELAYWAMELAPKKKILAEKARLKEIIDGSQRILDIFTMNGVKLEETYPEMPIHTTLVMHKISAHAHLDMLTKKYCELLPPKNTPFFKNGGGAAGLFGKDLAYLGDSKNGSAIDRLKRERLNKACNEKVYTLEDLEILALEERLKELDHNDFDIEKELEAIIPGASDRKKLEYLFQKIERLNEFIVWLDESIKIIEKIEAPLSGEIQIEPTATWVSILRTKIVEAQKIVHALENNGVCAPFSGK